MLDEDGVPPGFRIDDYHGYTNARFLGLGEAIHHNQLNLRATRPSLAPLEELAPDALWRVSCIRQPVSDAALDHLLRFSSLLVLDLTATKVTDAGMHTLVRLPKLHRLTLNDCDITDIGLAPIAAIPALEELELFGTRVTEDGLRSLVRHPTLRVLDLRHTTVKHRPAVLDTIPHLREVRLH